MQLAQFDTKLFLRDYWQQKPLLIKNPWLCWANPIEPDELAGLSCEDGIEARLISQTGGKGPPDEWRPDEWSVEHGPLPESRFAELGTKPWTLLVQAADHHVPDVAALIDPFRFIPNWRIDDVMVSYATDGGGVGPHHDQYDVFLIQGLGRRRWQIGAVCDATTPLLPNEDLRLLADFEAQEEWILEPGDILYLPPRVAHNGVAIGHDCMTYSVGFRAPSRSELIEGWCDDLVEQLPEDDRFADTHLQAQDNPGEITADTIARLHTMIMEKMAGRDSFARWFGGYSSAPKSLEMDWQPEQQLSEEALAQRLSDNAEMCRNPASRFAFIRQDPGSVLLAVDGECYDCAAQTADFAVQLCAQTSFVVSSAHIKSAATRPLITTLYNLGSIAFADED